jgi:2-keto-4-pentenoate hydratase
MLARQTEARAFAIFDPAPAAAAILEYRRQARSALPAAHDRPRTLADAYAVQNAVFASLGPIDGWKVSPAKPGAEPTIAPLLAAGIRGTGSTIPVPSSLPIKVEVELAFRLPDGLAGAAPPLAEIADRIELVPLIEVVAIDLPADEHPTAYDVIAAGAYNHGVVIGTPLRDWQRTDWAAWQVALTIDDAAIYSWGGPPDIVALVALVHWSIGHLLGKGSIAPGTVITTGALNGATPVAGSADIEADFGIFGKIETRIEARTGR